MKDKRMYAFRVVTESNYDGVTEFGSVSPIKVSASREKAREAARQLMREAIADDSDLMQLLPENGPLDDYMVAVNDEAIARGEQENYLDSEAALINTRVRSYAGIDYVSIRLEEVELDLLDGDEAIPKVEPVQKTKEDTQ